MSGGLAPGLRVFSGGFRRIIDATLTASAAMMAVAFILGGGGDPRLFWVDAGLSVVLVVWGVFAGLPRGLVAASSIPMYIVDLAANSMLGTHMIGLALVALRGVRVAYTLRSLARHSSIVGRQIITLVAQAGIMAAIMLAGGSLALYAAEAGAPGSRIHSVWDALWVSIATTTTVGYGDVVPATSLGRLVAGMLMIFGVTYITFLLTNIAGLLARIVSASSPSELDDPLEAEKHEIIETIRVRLHELGDEEFWELVKKLNYIRIFQAAETGALSLDLAAPTGREEAGEAAA